MRGHLQFLLCALAVACQPMACAKGVTTRIEISGEALDKPITVTAPDLVRRFSIWSGPNTTVRVRGGPPVTDYSGAFVDFPGGTVPTPPEDHVRLNVAFVLKFDRGDSSFEREYRVVYAVNPGQASGFMYIPPGGSLVYHGVEGHWLRTSPRWEKLMRPMVERALGSPAPARALP